MRDSFTLAIALYAALLVFGRLLSLLLPQDRTSDRGFRSLVLLEVMLVAQAIAYLGDLFQDRSDASASTALLAAYLLASVALLPLLMRGQPRSGVTSAVVGAAGCAAVVVVTLRLAVVFGSD